MESDTTQNKQVPCIGLTHYFFGPNGERPEQRQRRESVARSICQSCFRVEECLQEAIDNHEYGFWGGTNEDDRAGRGFRVPNGSITRAGQRTLRKQN